MKKTLTSRPLFVSLFSALGICAAFNLNAQSYSESYGSINLGQGNADVVSANGVNGQAIANNACVPTATAMGLDYLYSGDNGAFNSNPNGYGTVNTLITDMGTTASGTTAGQNPAPDGALTGLQTYQSANAPGISISQAFYPTTQSLVNALQNNQAVQLGILWGYVDGNGNFDASYGGGGHFFSLTGINLTTDQMTALDPWGTGVKGVGLNAGTSALGVTLDFSTYTLNGVGTVLALTYVNEYGADDTTTDNGTGASSFGSAKYPSGILVVDDIESVSAVPEPSTMALLLLPFGAGMLRMLRRNRTA